MSYPENRNAQKLIPDKIRRLLVAAYGFEDRSLGWSDLQKRQGKILSHALIFRYQNPKGNNKSDQLIEKLNAIGVSYPMEIDFDILSAHNIESVIEKRFLKLMSEYDEIVVDITAMTKFLILICLGKLQQFRGNLRIVYSEAADYAPKESDYKASKDKVEALARFPSRGFETILRARFLSSIRMQGQPVTLVAFTSFNEQLVRHMLGTINPHRLLFINGRPPRPDFKWREYATQEIHSKLINEFPHGNEIGSGKLLRRSASTLDYTETVQVIDDVYKKYGTYQRIIIAATGSKMQTVGLFFSKINHPDIHIEYPTPDSYFFKGMSKKTQQVHEIFIQDFSFFLSEMKHQSSSSSRD